MKIRWTRTTRKIEVGYVDILDDTPGLKQYLKAAREGLSRIMVDPQPAEWKLSKEDTTYIGRPTEEWDGKS